MSTLLEGVNEVLKKTNVLDSGAELVSLTDSARQLFIDTAIQGINETLDDLYSYPGWTKPNRLTEGTITLVTGDRDYALDSSLIYLRPEYPLVDETNNHYIFILGEGGYNQIVSGDTGLDDTGLPSLCAIRPTDGELFMDRAPTASENGNIYKYRYEDDLALSDAADVFPCTDEALRAIAGAVGERYKFNRHHEGSDRVYKRFLAQAARALRKLPARQTYGKQRMAVNRTDPFVDAG